MMNKLVAVSSISFPNTLFDSQFTYNILKLSVCGGKFSVHTSTNMFNVNESHWSWSGGNNLRGILSIVRVHCFGCHGDFFGIFVVIMIVTCFTSLGYLLGCL